MDLLKRLETLAAAWRADAAGYAGAAEFYRAAGNATEDHIKRGQSAVAMAHAQQLEALIRDVAEVAA